MTSLAQVAVVRSTGVLPEIPGRSLPEKLYHGRAMAAAAVRRHTHHLQFDVDQAEAVTSEIQSWMERNDVALRRAFEKPIIPGEVLASSLWLSLDKDKLRQWIIAQLTLACEGVGPWMSGEVARRAADPIYPDITDDWAIHDADMRLDIFGMIIRLEENGELQVIFSDEPPSEPEQELMAQAALPVITWKYVVMIIAIALIISGAVVMHSHLRSNNEIMLRICLSAQREGNERIVRWCLRMAADADPTRQISEQLTKAAVILGGGYLLIRFGAPFLLELLDERRGRFRQGSYSSRQLGVGQP
jgi:hypothetical protein